MDIERLKAIFEKLIYEETPDLDEDGARDILLDLVSDELERLRKSCE